MAAAAGRRPVATVPRPGDVLAHPDRGDHPHGGVLRHGPVFVHPGRGAVDSAPVARRSRVGPGPPGGRFGRRAPRDGNHAGRVIHMSGSAAAADGCSSGPGRPLCIAGVGSRRDTLPRPPAPRHDRRHGDHSRGAGRSRCRPCADPPALVTRSGVRNMGEHPRWDARRCRLLRPRHARVGLGDGCRLPFATLRLARARLCRRHRHRVGPDCGRDTLRDWRPTGMVNHHVAGGPVADTSRSTRRHASPILPFGRS